jgi:hypothetical protein
MTMASTKSDEWGSPYLPTCPGVSIDGFSLASIRDTMTHMSADAAIERAITSIMERWLEDHWSVEPIHDIRRVMESMRALPRGDARLASMNTFVRTLGGPQVLATFLDMMRDSAGRTGTREEELSRISRNARKHCVYGWAGQTLLVFSDTQPTEGTIEPEPGVRELLGEPPPAVWGLSMHIWQPNPRAKGFPSGGRIEADVIVEPPHSHPFDFASMVSIGTMQQSIYAQYASDDALAEIGGRDQEGRYDGVRLEHVDGVWPEHSYRSACEVRTLEASVTLQAGDSYHLPCDKIHDVEFDAKVAKRTPAITLFLASEAVVKPHVYMAPSMAATHAAQPRLKDEGRALPSSAWHAKLEAVASYLRGEQPTLCLDDIVKYDGEYAFFHG